MTWQKEFEKVWKRANGGQNIVGDLIMKDFIFYLLETQKKEILEEVGTELKKYKCGKHKKLFKIIKQLK